MNQTGPNEDLVPSFLSPEKRFAQGCYDRSRHVSVTASAFLGRMPGWRAFLFAEYAIHVEAREPPPTFFPSRAGEKKGRPRVIRPDPSAACVTTTTTTTPLKTPRPHLDFYKTVLRSPLCARRILRIFHAGHAFDSKGWTTGRLFSAGWEAHRWIIGQRYARDTPLSRVPVLFFSFFFF